LSEKCQIYDYQNKGWLSAYRIHLLQRKLKLGRKEPSSGPHAVRRLDIADVVTCVMSCTVCWPACKKFTKRWLAHRSNWNKQDCKTDSDKNQMTLSRHDSKTHGTTNNHLYTKHASLPLSKTKFSLSGYMWKWMLSP